MEGVSTLDDTETPADNTALHKLRDLIGQVKSNYSHLQNEVIELQKEPSAPLDKTRLDPDLVLVSRRDLLKLQKEVRMLKAMLSNTIKQDVLPAYSTLQATVNDLENAQKEADISHNERDHWRSQWEGALEVTQKDREEKTALRVELQDTAQQLAQQSEFCASMGAACCTLLWRVSRCEDSIQSILVGTKVDEFLGLVSSTLESYLQTYKDEFPSDSTDETQFVLALCGIVTNIAASAFGRDFLMKQDAGQELVNTYIGVLEQSPCHKLAKMKNLILMGLYNLTINQKGLKFISSKPGFMCLLAWQLQADNEAENRLNALRLIQSLIYEQTSRRLIHEAKEALPVKLLEAMCREPCSDIREAAKELKVDLMSASNEQ